MTKRWVLGVGLWSCLLFAGSAELTEKQELLESLEANIYNKLPFEIRYFLRSVPTVADYIETSPRAREFIQAMKENRNVEVASRLFAVDLAHEAFETQDPRALNPEWAAVNEGCCDVEHPRYIDSMRTTSLAGEFDKGERADHCYLKAKVIGNKLVLTMWPDRRYKRYFDYIFDLKTNTARIIEYENVKDEWVFGEAWKIANELNQL